MAHVFALMRNDDDNSVILDVFFERAAAEAARDKKGEGHSVEEIEHDDKDSGNDSLVI